MPKIVEDPSILAAARSAIDILLKFKGRQVVVLRKGAPVVKAGGGHDFLAPTPMLPQTFAWSQVGEDEAIDGENGDTPIVKRNYVLTARHDADIRVDDTWVDAEAEYRVETVNASNGFKVSATVVGFVKAGA